MSTNALNFRSLPVSERIELVEDIWNSIAEDTSAALPLSAEQRAELHRRLALHQAAPARSETWEYVRARLFSDESQPWLLALQYRHLSQSIHSAAPHTPAPRPHTATHAHRAACRRPCRHSHHVPEGLDPSVVIHHRASHGGAARSDQRPHYCMLDT